jgi:hypothetical protein
VVVLCWIIVKGLHFCQSAGLYQNDGRNKKEDLIVSRTTKEKFFFMHRRWLKKLSE